jgi:hypothetical protein
MGYMGEKMTTTRDYKAELESMRHMEQIDMEQAVNCLPRHLIDKLAEGPLPSRYDCGVCKALDGKNIIPDPSDPLYVAWIYHEIPKVDFRFADQNHYGKGADDIYRRCIQTYRAAGWTGEASEPNSYNGYIRPYHERERYG